MKKKKKGIKILISIVVLLLFAGCIQEEASPTQVSIFYGASSYCFFSEDQSVIDDLYFYMSELEYEETDAEIDFFTAFSINFSFESKAEQTFRIDRNGVMQVNDNKLHCKIIGTFDYDYIESVYNYGNPVMGK